MKIQSFLKNSYKAIVRKNSITKNKIMTQCQYKKSARFAGTFSLRALRAARFARKFERA